MNTIKTIQYVTPDLGDDVKEFRASSNSYAQTEAKHNAQKNQPTSVDELNAYIKNHIEIETQEQIHKNQERFLPICGMVVAKQIGSQAEQQCKELTGMLNEYDHESQRLEKTKKQLTPDLNQRRKRILSYLVIILIGLAEGYLIFEALRRSGFPLLPAIFTATGLAVGIMFLTHVVAEWIRRSATKKQAIIRSCIVLVPMFIFFMMIGQLRADAYNASALLRQQTEGVVMVEPGKNSGGKIAIVSFILYCIGLAISVRYAKTKEEKEQEKAFVKANREYKEVQEKINMQKAAIDKIKAETSKQAATALATYEYALARERQLEAIAKEALENYASTNLRHRTDGQCPPFFSTLPPFSFTTFFNNEKSN